MSIPAILGYADLEQELGMAARLVLFSLANHHNLETGRCFPSHETISRKTGVNVRSVYRALKELEGAGLIRILASQGAGRGKRRTDAYALLYPFRFPDNRTLCQPNADSVSKIRDTESGKPGSNQESQPNAREELSAEGVDLDAAVMAIWHGVGDQGRKRSSRPKVEKALVAALRRRPAGQSADARLERIMLGVRSYLASPVATKDGGEFEHGAHRTLEGDVWESYLEDEEARVARGDRVALVDPEVGTVLRPGPRLQRYWMETHAQGLPWPAERGPRPGMLDCRVDPALQREFGIEPFAPPPEAQAPDEDDGRAWD